MYGAICQWVLAWCPTLMHLWSWFKHPDTLAGYPTFKGQVLNGKQLGELIEGLEENNLLYYTHLLTGTLNYAVVLIVWNFW